MRRAREAHQRRLLLPLWASLLFLTTACGGSVTTEPETRGPSTATQDSTPSATNTGTATPGSGSGDGDGDGGGGAGGDGGEDDDADDGAGDGPSTNPEATPDEGTFNIELRVKVTPQPGAEPHEYILQCDGTTPSDASNVPKPEEACALVEKSAQALFFTQADPTLQCTQQYGGPQTATVSGSVDGRPVQVEFARTDGCEISRWNALEPLLGTGSAM